MVAEKHIVGMHFVPLGMTDLVVGKMSNAGLEEAVTVGKNYHATVELPLLLSRLKQDPLVSDLAPYLVFCPDNWRCSHSFVLAICHPYIGLISPLWCRCYVTLSC